jgi:hypothetical protein
MGEGQLLRRPLRLLLPSPSLPFSRLPSPVFYPALTPPIALVCQISGNRPKAFRNSSLASATMSASWPGGVNMITAPPHPAPVSRAPVAPGSRGLDQEIRLGASYTGLPSQ